jgi:ABC-2 type transport system ATP-binding protein
MRGTVAACPEETRAIIDVRAEVAQLEGVQKKYGTNTAVECVDLTIKAGELVALLGPNGAGKTTLVRMLLGLISPTRGTARVFGSDPKRAQNRIRTGAMLQVGRVPETLRVREHIDLFRSYYPHPLSLEVVLELAGLREVENREFGELSGGQKQRVLFALALCGDPDLIILDEPTLGMDVDTRRKTWQQIRKLVGQGKTVLLTTHYLEEADALADRIVVINRGKIVAEGTPDQIKGRVASKTIRCTTGLALAAIRKIRGVRGVVQDRGVAEIATSDTEETLRSLLLQDSNLALIELKNPGIEAAFLALTADEQSSLNCSGKEK